MNAHTSHFLLSKRIAFLSIGMALWLASLPVAHASAGYAGPYPQKPVITQQPTDTSVYEGQTLTLSVRASGWPEPGYQWRKDGANISGATAASYVVSRASSADTGTFEVIVSNRLGHVTSNAAKVVVSATSLPLVVRPPLNQTRAIGESATFEITVMSSPPPTYQWRKDGRNIAGATMTILTIANLQPSDAGSYDVLVSNSRGGVLSPAGRLNIINAPPAPTSTVAAASAEPPGPAVAGSNTASTVTRILVPPRHVAAAPGDAAALTITAAGEDLSFQWKKNGVALPGATAPVLATTALTASDMGFYSVTVTGRSGNVESPVAVVAVAAPEPSRLANLSTRGYVPPGGALTPGFTWRGSGAKSLLIRAVGPTLSRFGLGGVLRDPRLDVTPAGGAPAPTTGNGRSLAMATADLPSVAAATGAFALDPAAQDAALVASLGAGDPRNCTARITAADPWSAGLVLAEIYDADSPAASDRLVALSTLGFTAGGDRMLVPGFTIAGSAPKRLLLRAVGPGLAPFGVFETLADPTLVLYASGLTSPVAVSDDWAGDLEIAAAGAAVGAFPLAPDSRDAALVITLPPGSYTMAVTGSGTGTGNVLVEIYDLDR